MKKKILIFYCFLFLSFIKVYAAPVTYPRTSDDLRLPKNVDVEVVNVEEVMKIPAVDVKAKIYDFADILTDAEEARLFIQLNEYINNTGFDAIIVTTDNTNDLALKDYTYDFYDFNDFLDNGVSFVIYVGEDKTSIFMGNNGTQNSDVFTAYTNSIVSEILKNVYTDYIEKKNYVGACEEYVSLIDKYYLYAFGSYKDAEVETDTSIPWVGIIAVSCALTFIIVVLIVTKHKKLPHRVDLSIKNALSETTMTVRCEYDNPIVGNNVNNSQ